MTNSHADRLRSIAALMRSPVERILELLPDDMQEAIESDLGDLEDHIQDLEALADEMDGRPPIVAPIR